MIADSEDQLRLMRLYLAQAVAEEAAGNIEQADAWGAMAANKLATALHMTRPSNVIPFTKEQS